MVFFCTMMILSLPRGEIASGPVRNESEEGCPEHMAPGNGWRVASPQTDTAGPGNALVLSSIPTRIQDSKNFGVSEYLSLTAKFCFEAVVMHGLIVEGVTARRGGRGEPMRAVTLPQKKPACGGQTMWRHGGDLL